MFTGLIEGKGTIESVQPTGAGAVLAVRSPLGAELSAGDSIAVNGVCLTVTTADAAGFVVDVSPETLRVTTLGGAAVRGVVNLERPLRADARIGGHFVLGHVDGVGRIASFRVDSACYWLDVEAPAELARYFVHKGAIAVDGISLTIARFEGRAFGVQIVPFTWEHTSLSHAQPGDAVNLEADILGKYVARLLDGRIGAGDERPKAAGA
jgi:riboflavin synthase